MSLATTTNLQGGRMDEGKMILHTEGMASWKTLDRYRFYGGGKEEGCGGGEGGGGARICQAAYSSEYLGVKGCMAAASVRPYVRWPMLRRLWSYIVRAQK